LLSGNEENLVSTGISTVVTLLPADRAEKWDGVSLLRFDDIPCLCCGGKSVIVQTLEEQSSCPACRTGLVKKEGTCIY
jgi:hypothetical protein